MSVRLRDYDEKRDFMRMQLHSEAVLHSREQTYEATCIDLSSSGAQLQCKYNPAIGEQVEINIGSRHSQLGGLRAEATVMRVTHCEDAPESDSFLIGLKITRMLA